MICHHGHLCSSADDIYTQTDERAADQSSSDTEMMVMNELKPSQSLEADRYLHHDTWYTLRDTDVSDALRMLAKQLHIAYYYMALSKITCFPTIQKSKTVWEKRVVHPNWQYSENNRQKVPRWPTISDRILSYQMDTLLSIFIGR